MSGPVLDAMWCGCRRGMPALITLLLINLGGWAEQNPKSPSGQAKQPRGFSGIVFGVEQESGPVVAPWFFEGSPAAKAGVKEGDIILKVGNTQVKAVQDAIQAFSTSKPGDQVTIRVKRAREERDIPVTLAARPPEEVLQRQQQERQSAAFAPAVTIQEQDYAQARRHFKTKLTRKGPSPQPSQPVKPPQGVTEVEYVSGDLHLKAWLQQLRGETRKHPAVLFLHGGFGFDYPDDWDISKPYREAGFVVLTPILRAENGQPGAFSFYYDEVDDVLAAADYLRNQPYVDANRLYLAGPSAGGTLALLAAMTSKQFRAAASFSASPDQVLFCKHLKRTGDVPVDITNLRELEMRSPLAYAASLKCPTRIFYGSQEPHLYATSQLTAKLAKEHGLDVDAIKIEGDHSSSVLPGIKQSILFFEER